MSLESVHEGPFAWDGLGSYNTCVLSLGLHSKDARIVLMCIMELQGKGQACRPGVQLGGSGNDRSVS